MQDLIDQVKHHLAFRPTYVPDSFELWYIFPWSNGQLVVYKTKRRTHHKPHELQGVLSCTMLEQIDTGWQFRAGSGFGVHPPIEEGQLVQIAYTSGFTDPITSESVADIFGRTLSSVVTSVQATFNSGTTIECRVKNSCFALGDNASAVLELRLFDQHKQLLQSLDLRL